MLARINIFTVLLAIGFGVFAYPLAAQNISSTSPALAPSETQLDNDSSSSSNPFNTIGQGVLEPEFFFPESFEVQASGFDFSRYLSNESTQIIAKGPVVLTSDKGDTVSAERAIFDLDPNAETKVFLKGPIKLRGAEGIEIFANEAQLDETEEKILLTGNVAAFQGEALHRGETVNYYYETQTFNTDQLRTSFGPLLLQAGSFSAIETEQGAVYKGRNAGITTHDTSNPNYWIRSDEISVLPGDRFRIKNAKLYAGKVPIFWLPSLTQDFDGEFNYRPSPGLRSNWGAYLLNYYSQDIGGARDPQTDLRTDPSHEATWRLDFYSRRGVGVGLDLQTYDWSDAPLLGNASLYYIYDLDPTIARSAEPRDGFDDPNRFQVKLQQRANINLLPGAEGYVDLNTTLLSDRFLQEDFIPKDFLTNFQPDNTISFSQQWKDAHLLTLWGRFRVNDFYQSDQRLPELAFDQVRRPLFGTSILHESQNLIGLYREDIADFLADDFREELANPTTTEARRQTLGELLSDRGFARFHTYHEFSLPWSPHNGIEIIPRAGIGHTAYTNIENGLASQNRTLIHAGLDASLKFTKSYPDWFSEKWGLNSALHVFQPYASLSYLQTDNLDATLQPIDRLTASVRPRTLHLGRFAAIDDIADWQIARLGVRNHIFTKRDGSSHNWLTIDSYLDVFGEDPEFDRDFSNLYTDIYWNPLPWLSLTLETQIPLFSDSNFTELATGLQWMPNDSTEIGLRHRFLKDHPILEDSNRLELRAYHRINERWGISGLQRWEFEDDTLEFQQYSLRYNLDSWILSVGAFSRDNLTREEYGLLLGLTLTEFPSLNLPLSLGD